MLLFKDDTAVFTTSLKKLQAKLERLKLAADSVGMVVHPTKSKYICVNDSSSSNIRIDEVTISHTEKYVYLGTPITNGPIAKQVASHVELKEGHVTKYSSFMMKNADASFAVKQTVWNSALMSAILYRS